MDDRPEPGEWKVLSDPKYWVQSCPLLGGLTISFRHPEQGWLHFHVPAQEIERPRGFLATYASPAPLPPSSGH
jgi:hypothetical protein